MTHPGHVIETIPLVTILPSYYLTTSPSCYGETRVHHSRSVALEP